MKTLSCILLTVLFTVSANAQGWRLNTVSAQTGKTPLSDGIDISATVSDSSGNSMLLDFSPVQGEMLFFHSVIKNLSFGPTVGFFKNVAWIAPVASADFFDGHFTLLVWIGWSFGNPELGNTSPKLRFCFNYEQATVNVGSYDFYYALLGYQKFLPENIFGINKSFSLTDHFAAYGGVGYMEQAEEFLWSSGIKYSF
jgi:hypothetical protein